MMDRTNLRNFLGDSSQKLNRKNPEHDGISNELLKYGSQRLTQELTNLIKHILY